jgi:hypothetical protein
VTLATTLDSRRALIQRGRRPLVGYVSLRNTLAVTERDGRTRVAVDMKTQALLLVMSALFGPGLALLFVTSPERFTRMPMFIQLVVAAAIAGMTFLLLRSLVRRPSFELQPDGKIVVSSPSMTIRRDQVTGIAIETDMYSNSSRIYVPNSVLVVRTASADVRLCASPDVTLIASLAQRVAALTGKDVNHPTMDQQVNQ